MMRLSLKILLLILLLPVLILQAQEPPLPLAVEYQEGLYILNGIPADVNELPQALLLISGRPGENYHAVWSPDGTKLAFIINADDEPNSGQSTLMVWDGGSELISLVEDARLEITINWTRDGRILYALN